ncbi:hypothetical protein RB195_017307 [Necator americanus]|uniref:Uncharacterized protein n=1 Tax=Necator americanus TaxID=51031 RepID=A0ABR1C6S7_NECAM
MGDNERSCSNREEYNNTVPPVSPMPFLYELLERVPIIPPLVPITRFLAKNSNRHVGGLPVLRLMSLSRS